MSTDLPINKIIARDDARAINAETVVGLAESIANVGLINPIRVRVAGDGWEVIAGVHRLEACKSLGLVEIPADVVADDDLHAELAMIDENLCRAELTPSDRARQTARRKAIYEELFPEAAHGKATKESGQLVHSFADATAAVTGADARTVRRDAERGEKILPEVLEMIRGTPLDTGVFMEKIKNMPGSDQYRVAERDLRVLRQRDRNEVQEARKTKLDADIRNRADRANAELLAEYLPPDCWDHFKSNAAVGSLKGMLVEFANITGNSIMDRKVG